MFEKNWRFITPESCAILLSKIVAQPKCPVTWPDDAVLCTRLRDCNTIRRILAVHNINILLVVWRIREVLNSESHQKPLLVISSVHNTTSQNEIAQWTRPSLLAIFWQKLSSFQRQSHDLIFILESFNVYNPFNYILEGKILQNNFASYAQILEFITFTRMHCI